MNHKIFLLALLAHYMLSAFDDSSAVWSIGHTDADKPLRTAFRALMYSGDLDLFKQRMPLMEELSYSSVQRLLGSCVLRAGAVEFMQEQYHQLPALLLAIDDLYTRSPTSRQKYTQEAYAMSKIKEAGADAAQRELWEMIKETNTCTLRRIMKIKQSADTTHQVCDTAYLNALLERLNTLELILENESNQYVDAIDDNYAFVEHRKGHVYIKPLGYNAVVQCSNDTPQEGRAMHQMMRRIVAQRAESDIVVFKAQLKELAESDLTNVYRLFDTLKGCQYGNRVLAAYDPAVIRGALEVTREIDDMEPYASTDEYCDASGQLRQPISDFIILHDSLEKLSARREWKYIFCAEKVIARMQEPAGRDDRIHADWQHLRSLEYAIADELLLWHPVHTMQGSDGEAEFSVIMEREKEQSYERRLLGSDTTAHEHCAQDFDNL